MIAQIQLAGDTAVRIEQGVAPAEAVPATQPIDMARSLSPFVIVYDELGHPVASQGLLNGSIPTPPPGVFENVLKHGEERLSWQPVRGSGGVRIATVIQRVNGPHPGYVLAGRNMREVEARMGEVQTMAELTWLGMLGVILVGTIRSPPTPAPTPAPFRQERLVTRKAARIARGLFTSIYQWSIHRMACKFASHNCERPELTSFRAARMAPKARPP